MPTLPPATRTALPLLLGALVLMLAFAGSYVGAFHTPTPHDVPVAVFAPGEQARAAAAQLDAVPGAPLDARAAPSREAALQQIDDREVYGAYDAGANRLYVASAANRATATALERTFGELAAQQGRPAPAVQDAKPLAASDPNGTVPFYAIIAWVFGGYFAATLLGLVAGNRSASRGLAAWRMGALAAFAAVGALASTLLLHAAFDVFDGHVLEMWAIAAAVILAAGVATAGLQAIAGMAGTGLGILLFVIVGNAASGGPFARPLLPGFWRAVGEWLPPGAAVDLARGVLFFDGAGIAGPLLVLGGWTVGGAATALWLGGRRPTYAAQRKPVAAGLGASGLAGSGPIGSSSL